jgi:hypothetical protein
MLVFSNGFQTVSPLSLDFLSMPANENDPSACAGQKRSGALQLGARKKVYVVTFPLAGESTDLHGVSAVVV